MTKQLMRGFAREQIRKAGYGRGYRLNVRVYERAEDIGVIDQHWDFDSWGDSLRSIAPGQVWVVVPQLLIGAMEGVPMDTIQFRVPEK